MKPYYEHDGITLYCGDCREILPEIGRVDLVLTDPPYGIQLDTDYSRFNSTGAVGRKYEKVIGDGSIPDYGFLFPLGKQSVIFGAHDWPQQIPFNCLRDGWICWDKRTNEESDKLFGAPFDMAVVLRRRLYKIIRLQHCGVKNADGDKSGRFHPTQKPIALMNRILSFFNGESVLDPFCGSGTTLLAAKKLGRRAIGIEISEAYCEIAAKRLEACVMLPGFNEPALPETIGMFDEL